MARLAPACPAPIVRPAVDPAQPSFEPARGYLWNVDDVVAMQALSALGGRYLPWTAGALRPGALAAVLNEVVLGSRERILECGAGLSTVYIARLLAQRGGRVVSLEHDPAWADYVEGELEAESLDDRARVIRAPLEPHPLALDESPWYAAREARAAAESLGSIDLLLVDGPPADRPATELARYPALPAFAERLSPAAAIVLDDAGRPGEHRVLERWRREAGVALAARPDLGGIALGYR